MSNRRLSLHVSALTDEEYTRYTAVLDDIAPDGDELSVRETRAWLRGRHPDAPVDDVLRLFSPTMRAADRITKGQYYAAMRLLTHAQYSPSKTEVDRSLAFVQPPSNSMPTSPTSSSMSQAAPCSTQLPKPQSMPGSTNPFWQTQRAHNPFAPSLRPGSTSPTRPFSPPLPSPCRPPLHPSTTRSLPARSHPFPPPRPGSTSPTREAPSLPPRKSAQVPIPPPPRRPPAPPIKPKPHTSTLMKQSLQASKAGSAMKRAEESLEKERVMQVLKSSNGHNGVTPSHKAESTSSASLSGSSGSDKSKDRNALPSPPMSATSLEQVALAKSKPAVPPPRHPALSDDGAATPTQKPPRHPALSDDGTFVRGTVGRSRSVHHPSPPSLSRRKRPESVQVLMGEMNGGIGLSRHASLGPQLQRRLGRLINTGVGEERESLMDDEKRGQGDWARRGDYDWDDDQQTPTAELDRDNLKWPVHDTETWQRL